MGNTLKSFAAAVVLGFALLFFGPATSTAQADQFRPHVSFQGHFPLPHGSINVNVGHGRHFRNRAYYPRLRYARPYYGHGYGYGRSSYRQHRPYRLVRVLVHDPFPRWTYRRVYSDARYAVSYCPY